MNDCFLPADFLLPDQSQHENWAVIACDQYTSNPEYWEQIKDKVGDQPSALYLILPEVYLEQSTDADIQKIHNAMQAYLDNGIFKEYSGAYIYVERTLLDGSVRQGILGVADLECYDFRANSRAPIRATEQTVLERIPPRVSIRKDAALELSHVILFCDDPAQQIIESLASQKEILPKLYDFDLMQGGGHISGWLIEKEQADTFARLLREYAQRYPDRTCYLVADGNHSLVTAKRCYEALDEEEKRRSPARYAMVELENIHSPAIRFEPIHRLITQTDGKKLLTDLKQACQAEGTPITWVCGKETGQIFLKHGQNELPIAAFQKFFDGWLPENAGKLDYIHDDDVLIRLAGAENAIGFLMPEVDKSELFTYVAAGNTLPRKTFSLGHAAEKRYYLEGRKIK